MKNQKVEVYILNKGIIEKILKEDMISPKYDLEFIEYLIRDEKDSTRYIRYFENKYLEKLFQNKFISENLIYSGIYQKVDDELDATREILEIRNKINKEKQDDIIDELVDDIIYDMSNKLSDEITERDIRDSAEINIQKYDVAKDQENDIIEQAVKNYINL